MLPYLRAANVNDGALDLTDVKFMNFEPSEQKTFALRAGDVLITEGSGSLTAVGASAVWNGELSGTICFQNTLVRLRPRPGISDGRYLGWWARAAYASGEFASIASGANIYHISAERVKGLPAPLPPLVEQRRIADFLDAEAARVDELCALQARVLSGLRLRDQAVRDNLVERLFLEVGGVPIRRRIRTVEQGSSPSCFSYARESDQWGVIKLSAVKCGVFYPGENKKLPDDVDPVRQFEIRDGDLLVTRANTPELVGDAAVVEGAGRGLLLPDLVYRIVLDQQVVAGFAVQVLLSTRVRDLIRANARGSSQSMIKIRGEDIRDWPIPRATCWQQEALVSAMGKELSSSAEARAAIGRQLDRLAERRQALITAAVTGQVDVTTARGVDV